MSSKSKLWLALIFLSVVALRLIIAFQTQGLDYEAYSVLRQVENIHNTGLPLFNDTLSYSGRTQIFSPVYHYFLASFTFFFPTQIVAKVIPNILASLIVIIVFFFALYFTKDELPALVIAGLSGIIPVFFDKTINSASIYTAVIPAFFMTAYFFVLTYKDNKHIWALLFSMVLLTFLHPFSIILVFCMLIYILLINIENFRKSYRETELVLFFLFFVFWANMTIYKRALLAHGDMVLFQNIPVEIVANSFKNITFLESIYAIGVVPLIFGLITIYFAFFVSNSKSLMLGASISTGIFILLWFKLINLDIGLIFLSISLIILASYSIGKTYERMKMVKLKNTQLYFLILLIVISVGMFIPSVVSSNHQTLDQNDMDALLWMRNNTEENAVILALPEEGSALSYVSGRKNVMDDNYILIKNIDARYRDVSSIYSDKFITTALEKLNYYSVDYIFLSEYNQIKNNISDLGVYDDSCFEIVYPEIFTEQFLDRNLASIQINADQDVNAENNSSMLNGSATINMPNYYLEGTMHIPKIYRVKCKLSLKSGR
jgi:dolichyl-diphosphooligosaccharide--protein glycosyltransferase